MKNLLILLALCTTAQSASMQQNGVSPTSVVNSVSGQAITPASIATTGDSTIGGQLVVKGTATIQGTSFSVGGSTFSCSGGSCTTAGVKDGSNAAVGFIGEVITANASGAQTPGTDVYVSLATATLTSGDWDVYGTITILTGATTAATSTRMGISLNANAAPDSFATGGAIIWGKAFTVSDQFYFHMGPRRISVSVSTPVYLTARLTFTVAGGFSMGDTATFIYARRVR